MLRPTQLSCEFATLDISDAIGLKRFNLTKTVRKQPITEHMVKAGQVRWGSKEAGPCAVEAGACAVAAPVWRLDRWAACCCRAACC